MKNLGITEPIEFNSNFNCGWLRNCTKILNLKGRRVEVIYKETGVFVFERHESKCNYIVSALKVAAFVLTLGLLPLIAAIGASIFHANNIFLPHNHSLIEAQNAPVPANQAIAESEVKLSSQSRKIANLESDIEKLKVDLETAKSELKNAIDAKKSLDEKSATDKASIKSLEVELSQKIKDLQEHQNNHSTENGKLRSLETDIEKVKKELESTKSALNSADESNKKLAEKSASDDAHINELQEQLASALIHLQVQETAQQALLHGNAMDKSIEFSSNELAKGNQSEGINGAKHSNNNPDPEIFKQRHKTQGEDPDINGLISTGQLLLKGQTESFSNKNPQEIISGLIWNLMFRAYNKNQDFSEGSFKIQDNDSKILDLLKKFGPEVTYPRISSHCKGLKTEPHLGIDVDTLEFLLPSGHAHVLIIPIIREDGTRWLLLKPEPHGTRGVWANVCHAGGYLFSVARMFGFGSNQGAGKRKERIPELERLEFTQIISCQAKEILDRVGQNGTGEGVNAMYKYTCDQAKIFGDKSPWHAFKLKLEEKFPDHLHVRTGEEAVFGENELKDSLSDNPLISYKQEEKK